MSEEKELEEKSEPEEPKWYVIHTYSDYENKVKNGIEAAVDNRNMSDQILEVRVPTQEVTETRNGKTVTTEKKLFPGYVIVYMYMNDETWYVIRNTRGVTGFVGPESKPIPLSEKELTNMGLNERPVTIEAFEPGDYINVVKGPLEGFTGVVKEVLPSLMRVKANLTIFGRETLTELDFNQIKKKVD